LEHLSPTQRVQIEMIRVYAPDWDADDDSARRIAIYADTYRQHGPYGMDPVVCMGSTRYVIAGMHRMYAAHVAGLTEIPTYVVSAW